MHEHGFWHEDLGATWGIRNMSMNERCADMCSWPHCVYYMIHTSYVFWRGHSAVWQTCVAPKKLRCQTRLFHLKQHSLSYQGDAHHTVYNTHILIWPAPTCVPHWWITTHQHSSCALSIPPHFRTRVTRLIGTGWWRPIGCRILQDCGRFPQKSTEISGPLAT